MIYASNKDAMRYKGISAGLDIALEHLTPEFLAGVGKERVEIKGSDVYCFKVELETVPENKAFFENHRDYMDIHVVVAGEERMGIALPEALEMYEAKPENDAWFYHGSSREQLILTPGSFLVAFPEDAHMTCMMVDKPDSFTKVVFKIHI